MRCLRRKWDKLGLFIYWDAKTQGKNTRFFPTRKHRQDMAHFKLDLTPILARAAELDVKHVRCGRFAVNDWQVDRVPYLKIGHPKRTLVFHHFQVLC